MAPDPFFLSKNVELCFDQYSTPLELVFERERVIKVIPGNLFFNLDAVNRSRKVLLRCKQPFKVIEVKPSVPFLEAEVIVDSNGDDLSTTLLLKCTGNIADVSEGVLEVITDLEEEPKLEIPMNFFSSDSSMTLDLEPKNSK